MTRRRARGSNGSTRAGRYPNWVLFAVLAGMFATSFPITILAVALGPIAEEFGVRETTIAWVITAPMLLSAVAFPLLGKLGDLHGHRRVFLLGFAGATVVAALTAFAWDAYSLIGLRTLAAVLGSATQPTAMALIFCRLSGGRTRARHGLVVHDHGAAAPALGLILGGPLVDLLGWRVVFLLQAGMSAGALAWSPSVLRETRAAAGALRRPRRACALAVGVAGFMVALGGIRELGSCSPGFPAAACSGVVGDRRLRARRGPGARSAAAARVCSGTAASAPTLVDERVQLGAPTWAPS